VRSAARRVRDRHLPEPFRSWIDRAAPLPPGVTILPRTVSVLGAVLLVFLAVIGCVGLGVPIATVVPRADLDAGGWAVVGLIAAALVGLLVWQVHRLGRAIGARRDRAAGALRQGILVGSEGVLVRLAPNRCYPILADRFLRAEEWSGGGVEGSDYLRIVTRDGPVDIWDHDITADAAEVNRAVAVARAGSTGRGG
jgi:membrane protein implicated in regulation of membrane protease activity